MLPLVPIAIASLVGGAYYATSQRKEKGVLTAERQAVFELAINEVKDVNKLKALAKAFREQGLEPQAELLEKRAKLRELPPEVKTARKETFRKAMASSNPDAVRAVAKAYDAEGATGAANALRAYADSLIKKQQETVNAAPPVPVEHKENTPETKVEGERDRDTEDRFDFAHEPEVSEEETSEVTETQEE